MTSCAGGATVACSCRDEARPDGDSACVIVSPLLAKAAGQVLITVTGDDDVPVLTTSKQPGRRLVAAAKEAVSLSVGFAFPMAPPVSSRDARAEARSILALALPMILTGLLLYLRSMISMLFLGRLGGLALAGGSLAIGFANITGYSVLSGLAMGMEPICGQAFGAGNFSLLGITMQRTVLLLIAAAVPIGGLWMHMRPLLLLCGQEASIAAAAETYILASLPDLVLQAFIHPVRIYLRTQSINLPLTVCAALAIAIHLPINYVLVTVLGLGIKGVAFASVLANLNLLLFLLGYIFFKGVHKRTGGFALSGESFRGWGELISLALPSCVSVCLEWWWYEIMILLCGLLLNPQATVASMGILIQTTSLIYIFPSSLSFGVSTRVSNELGAGQPEEASRAATVGLMLGFAFGGFASAFAFLVRNVWASMFTADPAIIALTASVLPILGLCELGNCPQTTGCGVLRGSARPKDAASINLRSFYLVGTPVALVLAFWFHFDFKGLWFGLMAAQATCMVRMLLVIGQTDWASEAKRSKQLIGAGAIATDSDGKAAAVGGDEKSRLLLDTDIERASDPSDR
ncbi:Protein DETOXIFICATION 49 [Dichanthelium oligosanthes]|uniref:Protein DETOXIFICATION n=1 Tax=Dichanthelium oligosanthes TaxID=888268 RepID=A0A1E5WGU9_9POAL|nr:Protein DETOXIFICATION 49 [Dichanthelium oligosanthes]